MSIINKSLTKKYGVKSQNAEKYDNHNERVKFVMAIAAVAVCMVLIIVAWNMGKKHVALEDYVELAYTGADGYAEAECIIKEDELIDRLIGKGADESKEYMYRQFAESLKGYVTNTDKDKAGISNGDKLSIEITYDKELARAAGVSVGSSTFNMRAKGVENGRKINLFDNVEVIFAGISPDAYVVTRNTWEDEFLSQLSYTADKASNITVNDEITIHCNVDASELGRHGYITDCYDKIYKVDKLSTYVEDNSQIDKNVLQQHIQLCINSIKKETEDTSFRILYKASDDKKYLHEPNEESADNVTLIDSKFLKRKDTASRELAKNKIVLIFSADITCSGNTEIVYFAYVYENAYMTTDGNFNVLSGGEDGDKYYCSINFDTMMSEVLDGSEDNYSVYGISIK